MEWMMIGPNESLTLILIGLNQYFNWILYTDQAQLNEDYILKFFCFAVDADISILLLYKQS